MESLNKFWRILKSRFVDNDDEDWVKQRRAICATCEYNSLNSFERTFKQKIYKHLSDFYTWITRAKNEDLGQCKCLCSIYHKTAEELEQCYSKEIGKEDKWKSIYIPNGATNNR